ncbi:hypothetical protein PgNI_10623, partial [Pyricularia grisea]|uniref:Uncharacterized protein n=1 Tax=Pyricularia grisea TaxID=148305 RepID=A0A6P8AZB1_PYRGI
MIGVIGAPLRQKDPMVFKLTLRGFISQSILALQYWWYTPKGSTNTRTGVRQWMSHSRTPQLVSVLRLDPPALQGGPN